MYQYDNSGRQRARLLLATLATSAPVCPFQGGQLLSGISPSYLADDCHLVADALEQAAAFHSEPNMHRDTAAPLATAFSAAGRRLWNSLPSHLKDADLSYNEFRRSLKTSLFG